MAAPDERWSYSNNARIFIVFLGTSVLLAGSGVAALGVLGREAADVGLVLLSVATFLLVFALVLLGPRFVRRRARSFRLIADGSLDEIEEEVRRVLEEMGHRVDDRSRESRKTIRLILPAGLDWWFRLEPVSSRVARDRARGHTEVVQVGARVDRDEGAQAARRRLAARLSASTGA